MLASWKESYDKSTQCIKNLTKVHLVKAIVFPVVMYRCESWTTKETWVPKNSCFQTVVLEKTLESPLDCKEIKSVHFSHSIMSYSATPWTVACQASLTITNFQSLFKLMSIKSVKPSNHLILCHPLLLPPSIFSSIRVFSNESILPIRWPKYWRFSFSISYSNEYSGLFFFRIDRFDLLAIQETLKSLSQHHSSKESILQRSAFFIVQLSHEIKSVHPKGNQPWIFTGRTDAEAERPLLSPPDSKSLVIGKAPDARKDWRQEKRGAENEMAR